jgi:hypothetical protein
MISSYLYYLEMAPFRGVSQGIFGDNPVNPIHAYSIRGSLLGKRV